ncbi:flagellar biosynthesis protein FlgE [Bordetella genomosp. 9]|uniref:Flagellar hook protein FlgE n=1 Tax=Bordetella genomosp. 9 TaxID=1416803 RepID=A0A261R109_9BORD|nr:flagellar hook protein FlgE [Bordetella genomosp. 9]OZI18417.1 flagellar biosynthesis protein FlgE [Bordetella genomosp. 9]
MGFGQGLSGLDAASQNLDVIGNNIANANTVGFKSATATFADIYATSRVGLGVKVASIDQRFTVGNVTSTGGQYDLAIDGANGFFRMVDGSGAVSYTRNGQFGIDKDNNIINAAGQQLTGYGPGGVGTAPVPLSLPTANIAPAATTKSGFTANLNANAAVIPATTDFDPTNTATYTDSQPMTVYDSLGNSHQLTTYFAKRAGAAGPPATSVYDVYYTLDGAAMAPTTPPDATTTPATPWGGATQLTFDTSGRLLNNPPTVNLSFATPGGTGSPAAPLAIAMDYTGTSQFGGDFSAGFTPDGNTTGEFTSISFGKDGSIIANYTNGKTQTVGTVALASFNNVNGLQPIGDNAWSETSESGQAVLGQPGTNGLANLQGQAVEASNVNLSTELVNMIVAQRTYQANTNTIKTQDQVLQSLLAIQ